MAGQRKKKRFSVNQVVVFRFNDRKIVGKVVDVKPINKAFLYEILCEDGKLYSEVSVDTAANQCIDTYLTRLFYKKYNIDENSLPSVGSIDPDLDVDVTQLVAETEEVDSPTLVQEDKEMLFDQDDLDPNW